MHIRRDSIGGSDITELRVQGVGKVHQSTADNGIVNEDHYRSSHWWSTISTSKRLCSTVDTVCVNTTLAAGKGEHRSLGNKSDYVDLLCDIKLTQ